jgi:hypothetical protein
MSVVTEALEDQDEAQVKMIPGPINDVVPAFPVDRDEPPGVAPHRRRDSRVGVGAELVGEIPPAGGVALSVVFTASYLSCRF